MFTTMKRNQMLNKRKYKYSSVESLWLMCYRTINISQWTTLHSESYASTEFVDFIVDTIRQPNYEYTFNHNNPTKFSRSLSIEKWFLFKCMRSFGILSLFNTIDGHNCFILIRWSANFKCHSSWESEINENLRVNVLKATSIAKCKYPICSDIFSYRI